MSDLPLWTGWLIELREGRGWSRPNLAARLRDLAHDLPADLGVGPVAESSLESIEKAVGRWETKGIVPSDRYCILLTHAYATSNGEATMGDGSAIELLMAAFAAMGVSVKRREYLRHLATSAATVAGAAFFSTFTPELRERANRALAHPNQTDLETVRQLREAVSALAQQSEGTVPYLRLVSATAPHIQVARTLLNGMQPEPIRQEICELGVQVFNLSGRLAFNLRDHASAKAFHQDAETIVLSELRDGGFKRWWLSSRARIARYNNHDLDEALYFAKQACRQPDGTSDYAAAWSFCVLAQMYSLNGSELKARKAIDLARVHAKGDAKDDPGAYLFPESRYGGLEAVRARISAYEGTCLLRHGQLLQAEAALKQSLAGIPEAIEGQVSFLLADLATVYIRQANPDPEQAAALLTRGAEIVNRTGSAIPTKRINKARHELRPWSAEPFVLELDEVLFPPSTHI